MGGVYESYIFGLFFLPGAGRFVETIPDGETDSVSWWKRAEDGGDSSFVELTEASE
jgi:hypothetical protein